MKILQVHNFYQQGGGEDQVCAAEYKLLTDRGHPVLQFLVHNDSVREMSRPMLAIRTIWNSKIYREVGEIIAAERPDVVHAHNTFPLVSPALYYAAAANGVPVVQTLHNYRLLCPAATLFRDGHICEDCVGTSIPYRSVLHACYRGSRATTAVAASLSVVHQIAGTWTEKVQAFVALTSFSRSKFIEGGLPSEKIVVKPNCLATDPGIGDGSGNFAFFAGRLTDEKGLRTLITAWRRLNSRIPLKIAGTGPLSQWLESRLTTLPNVEWLGHCERTRVLKLLKEASFVVFPSESYENLPMVIIEAFACGTPVIAAHLGSIEDIVQDGLNGLYFRPGDASHLVERVECMLASRDTLHRMRESARSTYEQHYSAETNYILLMELYNSVILAYKKASTRLCDAMG